MHARITTITAQKDKIQEAIQVYRESILPGIGRLKGFLGAYLLADQDTGEGASITLWESEADSVAYESSGLYKEQVDKLRPFFTRPPALKSYAVTDHVTPPTLQQARS